MDDLSGSRQRIKRITRPLSDADRQKYEELRKQLDAEKEEIIAAARLLKRQLDASPRGDDRRA
jgi:hypothetical protein